MSSSPEEPTNPAIVEVAEGAMLLGEDNFRHLAEALPQIVWTSGPDGVLDYISPQLSLFSGVSQDDPNYLNWEDYLHPDDVAETRKEWARSCESGEVYEQEFRLRSADGIFVWFSSRAVPVFGSNDSVVKWYGTTTNVEDLKQAELTLTRSAEEKDKFIAMLGHELRNPLASISNSYHILSHENLSDEKRETTLELFGRQIDHLIRLVDDTLDISRLSTGKLRLVTSKLEVNQLVTDCVEDCQVRAEEDSLVISAEVLGTPVWVDGDSVRLGQCLNNLLSNAIKFTEPGGSIIVKVRVVDTDRTAIIEVVDTGVGMSPSELRRVFEPFRQGSSAQSLSKDGLGLGLAVIREIMELHGGRVTALSEGAGEGATFMLALPLTEAPEEIIRSENDFQENKTARILIVEDNKNVAATLEMFLELQGHLVRVAEDGESAFEALDQEIPDMVFCDLTLPGSLKGWDIAERIRTNYSAEKAPYLVALSGHAQAHHIEKSIQAGFDEHIAKPPAPEKLSQAICKALV